MGDETETYNPTPKELWVMPRMGISSPTSGGALARGELNTPSQNVDRSDEPDESADPTVQGR